VQNQRLRSRKALFLKEKRKDRKNMKFFGSKSASRTSELADPVDSLTELFYIARSIKERRRK
jgi:hypothetical protein